LIFTDADTIVSRELIEKSLDLMLSGDVCAGGSFAEFINSDLQTKKLSKWWNVFARKMKVACGAYIFAIKRISQRLAALMKKSKLLNNLVWSKT
jgi:hypothetical protein